MCLESIFKIFNPYNINNWITLIVILLGATYAFNYPKARLLLIVIVLINSVTGLWAMDYNKQIHSDPVYARFNMDMEDHNKYVNNVLKLGLVSMSILLAYDYKDF